MFKHQESFRIMAGWMHRCMHAMLCIVYKIKDVLFPILKDILISVSMQAILSYIIKPVQVMAITFKGSSASKPRFNIWCLLLNEQVTENHQLSEEKIIQITDGQHDGQHTACRKTTPENLGHFPYCPTDLSSWIAFHSRKHNSFGSVF